MPSELTFQAVSEQRPGPAWQKLYAATGESYAAWFLREGEARRPSYLKCLAMLEAHMPELVPMWNHLTELAGGGDHAARMLSLYCPTPYLTGCSQAVFPGPAAALLVRNYDYRPDLCEGYLLHSNWHGTRVIAMSDCLWGALDGVNEHGLCVSLSFGGRKVVGDGFGIPLVLRYILEFSKTAEEGAAVLERIPSHMAYNVLLLDRTSHIAAFVAPDRKTKLDRNVRVQTNVQGEVEWEAHAGLGHTLERQRAIEAAEASAENANAFVTTFLTPPVHQRDYDNAFGTLYTAVYKPDGSASLIWPEHRWDKTLDSFGEEQYTAVFP